MISKEKIVDSNVTYAPLTIKQLREELFSAICLVGGGHLAVTYNPDLKEVKSVDLLSAGKYSGNFSQLSFESEEYTEGSPTINDFYRTLGEVDFPEDSLVYISSKHKISGVVIQKVVYIDDYPVILLKEKKI